MRTSRQLWIVAALALWIAALAPAAEVKEVRKTLPLAAGGLVVLDSYKGRIEIATWDQPSVEMHAVIEPDLAATDGPRQVRDTEVRIDASADSIHIRTDFRKLSSWNWGFGSTRPLVHYTIKMPRSARLRLRDQRSDIRVADLRAGLELNTYRGSAVVASVEGPLHLETYRGRIRVDSARITGASRAETYRGQVELGIPRNAGFSLDAEVGRRGTLAGSYTKLRGWKKSAGYSGDYNGGGPTLRVKTYRGTLRLTAV